MIDGLAWVATAAFQVAQQYALGQGLAARGVVQGLAGAELIGAAANGQVLAGDQRGGDHGDDGHDQQHGDQGDAPFAFHGCSPVLPSPVPAFSASLAVLPSLSSTGPPASCCGGLSGRR